MNLEAFDGVELTSTQRQVVGLWFAHKHIGFLTIGRLLGISDSEARRLFDDALAKLKKQEAA